MTDLVVFDEGRTVSQTDVGPAVGFDLVAHDGTFTRVHKKTIALTVLKDIVGDDALASLDDLHRSESMVRDGVALNDGLGVLYHDTRLSSMRDRVVPDDRVGPTSNQNTNTSMVADLVALDDPRG